MTTLGKYYKEELFVIHIDGKILSDDSVDACIKKYGLKCHYYVGRNKRPVYGRLGVPKGIVTRMPEELRMYAKVVKYTPSETVF